MLDRQAIRTWAMWGVAMLFLTGLMISPPRARAGEGPLNKDDITLLLLGGASTEKIVALIERRGTDFQMNPDLAKRFHDAGASDAVIETLQRASAKVRTSGPATAPAQAEPPPATAPLAPDTRETAVPSTEEKVKAILDQLEVNPADAAGEFPPAPDFFLTTLSGQKFNLADEKGRVVLVNFWATWCGPCRNEVPGFVLIQERYRDQGLVIVGVAVDDKAKSVREFSANYGINYPLAMGDRDLRKLYGGITGLPTTFLVGRDGRIHYKYLGAVNLESLEGRVRTLLAARSTAPGRATSQSSATTAQTSSASKPEVKAKLNLADPNPEELQKIIQEFTAKERLFKEARNNYTYHQMNKLQQLDPDGEVVGVYEQEWDIVFDDNGRRIERVTYAPMDTLKGLIITQEDIEGMRRIQPFVLTSDELPDYEVKYLGHVKVDEITAYAFSIRPKEIQKGRIYFQGVAWVDDRDLQIVKSEGKSVGELKPRKGGENLFPRFTTYREQIDGKFWFPTYTLADDTLYFASGPIRVKQIIRYTEYKQFRAGSRIQVISEVPKDESKPAAKTPASPPK